MSDKTKTRAQLIAELDGLRKRIANLEMQGAKQNEDDLRASEERYRTVADYTYDWEYWQAPDGQLLYASPSCERITGYSAEEFMNNSGLMDTIVHPGDHFLFEQHKSSAGQVQKEHEIHEAEFRIVRKDGEVRWIGHICQLIERMDGTSLGRRATNRDITESRQMEEALRGSEKRFRALIENSTDAIALLDATGSVVYNSPAHSRISGYSYGERLGRNMFDLVHPDDREHLQSLLKTLRSKPGPISLPPTRIQHVDGSWRWIEGIANNLLADPSVQAIVVNFRDITERRRAEEALRESEDKFKYVFDHSVVGKSITLPSGEVQANHALSLMLGYSIEELCTLRWQDITHPDDIELTQKALDPLLAGETESLRIVKRYLHKDGSTVWADASTSLRRDKDGNPLYFMTVVLDITERKRAEETIRSLARFPSENPNPVLRIGQDGDLLYANDAAFTLLADWKLEVGRPAPKILRDVAEEVFEAQVEQTAEELCGERIFAIAIAPTPGAEYVNLYARDVTERRQAEEKVRSLNAELEERVRLRTEQLEAANNELEAFSYTVSHDLRAPLRAMDGFSRLLIEGSTSQLSEEGVHYLHRVRENAQQMGRLIDDLLAFSRLSRQPLTRQSVSLTELAQQVIDELKPEQVDRQVEIEVGDLPIVQADPVLLKVVLMNLLGNALKYTRRCQAAHIQIGTVQQAGEQVYFIKDNGVGFDMQYSDKLFGVFQRLHRAEDYEGTGVGLATVQRIVHRHDGRVWAEGAVGQGAAFYFTLGGNT